MKQCFTLVIITSIFSIANAQLELTTAGDSYIIDFAGFAGDGFDAAGSDGFLDADTWAIMGFSDGDKDFGEEATTGDFARGSTMGGVSTGGVYAVDILGNQGIMVQPIDADFTPGSFRLKIWNNTGNAIGQIDVAYELYAYNDQGRSSSFNFAHSADNISYTDEPSLNFTSGEAATFLPETETKFIAITGLNIPDGEFYYLKWEGDDVAGSGSRDEFALDDINITPFAAEATSEIQFSSIVLTATEGETATSYVVISEPADCSIEVSVDPSSTADASDYEFTSPLVLDFSSGGDAFLSFDVITNDDVLVEPSETIVLKLDNVTGGCTIGFGDTFTLHVLDNDATTPTVVDIADITTEDANGVAESIGEYVEITGTVYGINLDDDDGLDFYIIDETSGINVFNVGDDLGYTVEEGDAVTIIGIIDQYNGLTQIIPESIVFLSSSNSLSYPESSTLPNENTESSGVFMDALTFVDESQWLGDGSTFEVEVKKDDNIFIMRIDNSTDLASISIDDFFGGWPTEYFHCAMIGSQNDNTNPYTSDYLFIPMSYSNFSFPMSIHGLNNNIEITLFPNPVLESLQLRCSAVIESVEIFNVIGEYLGNNKPLAFESSIDVQYLLPGMYIAKITTKQGITTSTFFKQ